MKRNLNSVNSAQVSVLAAVLLLLMTGTGASLLSAFASMAYSK